MVAKGSKSHRHKSPSKAKKSTGSSDSSSLKNQLAAAEEKFLEVWSTRVPIIYARAASPPPSLAATALPPNETPVRVWLVLRRS